MYTVKEWVNFAGAKYVQLEESFQLAPGVALIQTPGHTVGHQSIAVDTATGLELIVAQAAYTAAEFESYRTPTPQSTDNASSIEAYVQSIRVLHDMNPKRAYFNHDSTVWHAET